MLLVIVSLVTHYYVITYYHVITGMNNDECHVLDNQSTYLQDRYKSGLL